MDLIVIVCPFWNNVDRVHRCLCRIDGMLVVGMIRLLDRFLTLVG